MPHFLRGFPYVMDTTGNEPAYYLKLLYEFWGYCINGTSLLTTPGAVNAATGPTNFFENATPSTVLPLMLTGSDGQTTVGTTTFSTAAGGLTSSHVGKHLVIWKPGSNSSEDAIYPILSVALDGLSCTVNVNIGGIPDPVTLRPSFTTRNSINFRIVSFIAASKLTMTAGNNFQMLPDPTGINVGQTTPRVDIIWRNTASLPADAYPGGVGTTPHTGDIGANCWFNSNSSSAGWVTVIGDKSFLMWNWRSSNLSGQNNSAMHIEIPKRIFTQAQDPNPVTIGYASQNGFTAVYENDGGQFYMVGYNDVNQRNRCVMRSLMGQSVSQQNINYIPGSQLVNPRLVFNLLTGKALMSDVALTQLVSGQYEAIRCVLNRVKVSSPVLRQYHLLGNSGEWIHLWNGWCWPWDGTFLTSIMNPMGGS